MTMVSIIPEWAWRCPFSLRLQRQVILNNHLLLIVDSNITWPQKPWAVGTDLGSCGAPSTAITVLYTNLEAFSPSVRQPVNYYMERHLCTTWHEQHLESPQRFIDWPGNWQWVPGGNVRLITTLQYMLLKWLVVMIAGIRDNLPIL